MSVIEHDFGGEPRRKTRRFRKAVGLDTPHDAGVTSNPLPYLERASERIFQLRKALFDADQAATPPEPVAAAPEEEEAQSPSSSESAEYLPRMVTISQDEYDRLRRCHGIVKDALALEDIDEDFG